MEFEHRPSIGDKSIKRHPMQDVLFYMNVDLNASYSLRYTVKCLAN